MTRSAPIRVLVADDNREYRDALSLVIERADGLELAGAAVDAAEAIELAARVHPDVALVDVRMPSGGAAAAVRGIAARSPETRTIAVSASHHSDPALDQCVVGRLLKSTSVADIVASVRRAADAAPPARDPARPGLERPAERDPGSVRAERILQARYGDRERVERLIHDRVQSRLAALRIHLGVAAARAVTGERPMLDDLVALTDEVIDEVRALAVEIYPRVLERDGLQVALRGLVHARIDVPGSLAELGRLPIAVENAIYFHCVDLARGAAQRAGGRASVAISLARSDGWIRCTSDVTCAGADVDGFPDGDELVALTDPIAALGGTVRVEQATASGVRVIAELPALTAR